MGDTGKQKPSVRRDIDESQKVMGWRYKLRGCSVAIEFIVAKFWKS
jgi:hypothetical protein